MNPDDDLENEEFGGLQDYARKGMAQELAKKLGLSATVPGADTDDADPAGNGTGTGPDANTGSDACQSCAGAGGDCADCGGTGKSQGGDIDPALLQQVLASLKSQ